MTRPFFSHKFLITAPDGTYRSFSGTKRVSAFPDRLEVGSIQIPYSRLVDLRIYGTVVHIAYAAEDGTTAEEYLRYDPFWPGRTRKTLARLLEYVSAAKAGKTPVDPAAALALATTPRPLATIDAPAPRYADRLEPIRGRPRIVVYSARASFPCLCPVCGQPAASAVSLNPTSGFAVGMWFIPVCAEHRRLDSAISLESWHERATSVTFSFANADYAEAFLLLNSLPPDQRAWPDAEDTELARAIDSGLRFVVYQFAIGALVVAMIQPSSLKAIEPGGSRFRAGIPYLLLSGLVGWWSFPSGPIFTLRALITNLSGGVDVTPRVVEVLRGRPVSASGL
jgi:hypothetical protein